MCKPEDIQQQLLVYSFALANDLIDRFSVHALTMRIVRVLEVIYPQVPLRIPCYDLAPLTQFVFDNPKRGRLTRTGFG